MKLYAYLGNADATNNEIEFVKLKIDFVTILTDRTLHIDAGSRSL